MLPISDLLGNNIRRYFITVIPRDLLSRSVYSPNPLLCSSSSVCTFIPLIFIFSPLCQDRNYYRWKWHEACCPSLPVAKHFHPQCWSFPRIIVKTSSCTSLPKSGEGSELLRLSQRAKRLHTFKCILCEYILTTLFRSSEYDCFNYRLHPAKLYWIYGLSWELRDVAIMWPSSHGDNIAVGGWNLIFASHFPVERHLVVCESRGLIRFHAYLQATKVHDMPCRSGCFF